MDTSPRPLNIGIFCAHWPPAHLGGSELQAARTARELAARGHRVHVFTRDRDADAPNAAAAVTMHARWTAPVAGLRLIGEIINCLWQARRVRTDVNLCYITLNSGLLGYTLRRVYGTPFVVAMQGVNEALPRPLSWRKRLERFTQARADRLWIQSQGLIELAQREYENAGLADAWRRMASRLRVISNGVDLPELPATRSLPPLRFLFVGRLVEEKSLPTLIEAARQLPNVEVQLVGDGVLEPQLRQLALGTRVEFLGQRPPEDIPSLLFSARALVLCSATEGLPNVVLEALSRGRPVIATPVGAVPELVQDGVNGRLVPVEDPEALAAAMRGLADDETWSRLAAAARPSVERFAWPRFIRDVERELVETAHAKRSDAPPTPP